jgi:hypothetical protein
LVRPPERSQDSTAAETAVNKDLSLPSVRRVESNTLIKFFLVGGLNPKELHKSSGFESSGNQERDPEDRKLKMSYEASRFDGPEDREIDPEGRKLKISYEVSKKLRIAYFPTLTSSFAPSQNQEPLNPEPLPSDQQPVSLIRRVENEFSKKLRIAYIPTLKGSFTPFQNQEPPNAGPLASEQQPVPSTRRVEKDFTAINAAPKLVKELQPWQLKLSLRLSKKEERKRLARGIRMENGIIMRKYFHGEDTLTEEEKLKRLKKKESKVARAMSKGADGLTKAERRAKQKAAKKERLKALKAQRVAKAAKMKVLYEEFVKKRMGKKNVDRRGGMS